jgi:hypothetical protein
MFASAALREYIVSTFLGARGAGDTIMPCTGLLVRRLPGELREICRNSFVRERTNRRRSAEISAADRSLQAITVKPGVPQRFSNFTWWLSNYPQIFQPGVSPVAELFSRLSDALSPGAPSNGLDGEAIVQRLFAAIDTAVDNLIRGWSHGVYWGSFHNNFSADGRFLDLETPLILASPTVGAVANPKVFTQPTVPLDGSAGLLCFGSVTQYLMQMKVFCAFLKMQLGFLVADQRCAPREAEFIESVLHYLEQQMSKETLLSSPRELESRAIPRVSARLSGGARHDAVLRALLREACWRANMYKGLSRPRPSRATTLHRVTPPIESARPEPFTRPCLYVPDFLVSRCETACDPASYAANRAIQHADELSEPDALLSYLTTVPALIEKAVGKDLEGCKSL